MLQALILAEAAVNVGAVAAIAIVALIVLVAVFSCINIVPQASEYVVERLGKYKGTWGAGVHLKMPFVERIVRKITLKEQVLDYPPQNVITKDNVTMKIDAVVYFKVFDSKLYTYGAVNPIHALEKLSATSLRNIVGGLDLDGTLTSRDSINVQMTRLLDEATDKWGIRVTRVELQNIDPPAEIKAAMEKQMKAERDKREALLQAEGHKAAAITRAEGDKQAMILAAEGERDARIARAEGEAKAILLAKEAEADGLRALREADPSPAVLELKKYESLVALSKGQASKIIIPSDVVDTVNRATLFTEVTGLGNVTPEGKEPEKKPAADPCCEKYNQKG